MARLFIPEIIVLEIENLSLEEKEKLYKELRYHSPKPLRPCYKWDKFKDQEALAKALENYFADYPDMLIAWQANNHSSLYRQALRENHFIHFNYKDAIKDLTRNVKDKIVQEIFKHEALLTSQEYPVVFLEKIDKEYIYEFESLPKSEQINMPFPYQKLHKGNELEKYNKNKFVLTKFEARLVRSTQELEENVRVKDHLEYILENYLSNFRAKKHFFKDDNELILFALNEPKIAHKILLISPEYLNPHYLVNHWIDGSYRLEQFKKDIPTHSNKKSKKVENNND